MSVGEMSVGEVSVGEMSVGEMSGYLLLHPTTLKFTLVNCICVIHVFEFVNEIQLDSMPTR